jgi:hypothetical protein
LAVVAQPEQQLAWEASWRPRAGFAAIAGGLLTLAGFLWTAIAFRDLPRISYVESLTQALAPGPIGDRPSLRTPEFQFYDSHAFSFVGSSVVRGIAYFAFAYAITFLAVAARARRPELPRPIVYIALVGAVLFAVAGILGAIGWVNAVGDYLGGSKTVDAASDVTNNSLVLTASLLAQLAQLAIAAGMLLVALNGMRTGLLTRFLGILGMITGALAVLPAPFSLIFPFLQAFWLITLGFLLLGLARGGVPPAWRTGTAEPWPTRAEVAAARRPAPPATPEPEAAPAPAGRPHPSSRKRKRKRRD